MRTYKVGGNKKARLEKRADKKMVRAQKTWKEAEGMASDAKTSGKPMDYAGAEQMYSRSERQSDKAKKLKAKASMMKTGGMVNPNAKVTKQLIPGSKGVKSGVNPKASASKVARGRVGGTSTAPKTAIPKAKYGMTMRKK